MLPFLLATISMTQLEITEVLLTRLINSNTHQHAARFSNVGQLFAADDFSRRHLSDAFFVGALRVKMGKCRKLLKIRIRLRFEKV